MAKLAGKDTAVVESLDESLEILQPEENFVEVEGTRIYVKIYTFSKLLKALKHLAKLQGILMNMQSESGDLDQSHLLQAFANYGDDVLGLLSLATDLPVEFFDEIPSDKGLDLAVMTYKVNESFFVQNLLPKLQELFPTEAEQTEEEPQKKSKKLGLTSSKN